MGHLDWEAESDPAPKDLLFLLLLALFFPCLRLFLDHFVFQKVATHIIDTERDAKREKIRKFKESAWKCVYYLSSELLVLTISFHEPWFGNTKYFWVGPGDQIWPDQKIKLKLKGLYMYCGGFYTYSIFALIFWETRRKDFSATMLHHVATVALIVLSYMFRFARVGSVVLAIHEGTDVIMEVAKMSRYSGHQQIANIAFVLFACSFTALRVIYFPLWVLWSTSYEVLLTLDKEMHMVHGTICYYVFNTLLFCLLVLQIYWAKLMFGMVINQIRNRGQISDDVRSDSESEDEHDD